MATNCIRVMLVDDHDMVRRGLAAFIDIQEDLEMVGEANNGFKAVQCCRTLQPDVILMDLVMPEMDGVTTIKEIKSRWPHIQIIALTSFQEKELVQDSLQAGAISYLLKNVTVDELAGAIRGAYHGRATYSPEATQALIKNSHAPAEPEFELTSREFEVLHLMVEGLSNPEIADNLIISRSTARAHVSNILAKLGASNRAEAISMAFRLHLVN